MIIEAVVTTINEEGAMNVAPMGPHVESDFSRFELKPFDTSKTYANLLRTRCGVLHVTDDTLLIARAAIGQLDVESIETIPAEKIHGAVIANSILWHEFEVDFVDKTTRRAVFKCRNVKSGKGRSWIGFNRAKHAILEAAILATRVSFRPADEISEQFDRLATIVTKTGGLDEQKAIDLLRSHVNESTTSKR